ncbi:hypothetical protein K1Y37_09070 [Serratia marcescens]|uniref:hypothetical protein n=1 Tax=Serratia marcescens TaxID=615 RepID=UPI001FB7044C|nr:hypothetical protein [Serratia marcescens]MCW6023036.1 hypothetical protein [Serratia marcescens]UOG72121.1 hypothetical protein MJ023_002049 [Serratia marcescens]
MCKKNNSLLGAVKKVEPYISLIVSIASLAVAMTTALLAKTIGDEQIRAAKIQYAPIFTFRSDYEIENEIYKTEYLSIENEGYPILNFNPKLDTVITIRYTSYSPEIKTITISLPISYYLAKSGVSGGKGKLTMFIGDKNMGFAKNLGSEISEFNKNNKNQDIINYNIDTIVKISYVDASEEKKTKYYINQLAVTESEYFAIYDKINGIPALSRNDLTLENLLKRIN